MKYSLAWTIASLLSVLFFTMHLAQDIVRGIEKGDLSNFAAIPMAVLWLSATLLLAERRSGYIIVLLFSILGSGIPVIHMMGKGIGLGTRLAKYSGHVWFVWTLIALGVTALFTFILSVHGLWTLCRGEAR